MGFYIHPLKVCSPEGKRVYAKVLSGQYLVVIQIKPLDIVEKDNPPFAKDGAIRFRCKKEKFQEVIVKLEKYLEDLFLKGMADEDLHRSLGIKVKSGRIKKSHFKRETRRVAGEGDFTSIHSGS